MSKLIALNCQSQPLPGRRIRTALHCRGLPVGLTARVNFTAVDVLSAPQVNLRWRLTGRVAGPEAQSATSPSTVVSASFNTMPSTTPAP